MSTLVAYDSSSEDEEHLTERDVPELPESASRKSHPCDAETLIAQEAEERPMVGPSIPSEFVHGYDEIDENDGGHAAVGLPSSERDMIRYLTQATHPMTEMPPSPPGSPNASAAAKFKHFLSLKAKGVHFNEDLAAKSAFRNPSLLNTLMDRAGLDVRDAYSTSLPVDVFDAATLPQSGFKEALLKCQQSIRSKEELEKKALAATGKRTIDFTSGGISAVSSSTSSPGGPYKRQRQ